MDSFEQELKQGFLDEAAQSLAETEQCFLNLEQTDEPKDLFEKIFRLAHNLKGSSKAVGFEDMGAFTHQFESLLLKLKNGDLTLNTEIVSLLLRCNDHLVGMVDTLKTDLDAKIDSNSLMTEIANAIEGKLSTIALTPKVDSSDVATETDVASEITDIEDDLIEAAVATKENTENTGADLFTTDDISLLDLQVFEKEKELFVQTIPETVLTSAPIQNEETPPVEIKESNKEPAKQSNATAGASEESIRVSVQRIEKLQNFVGELVILQAVLREQANETTSLLLKKTVHQMGKVCKEVQDISMSLRMVPVKPTFQKMQRIVRDTAQALQKEVQLITVGEETELDKTILEKINDPLVHLIRNAVDHGIESTETRIKNGKSAKGTVILSAFHQSGKLVIEIKDDGGGMNPEKLKSVAIKKGILKPSQQITDKEAYKLIFASGFSTKEQTTDISGRGVGMDVVKTNIEDISGEIAIDSVLGQGTVFKIILPLTMAIIDGMIVRCGEEKYVIPLAHVHESINPKTEDIQNLTNVGEVLMLRGENLQALRLANLLGQKSILKPEEMIAIIIRSTQKPFALLVDDIIGQFQVVTKQLGQEVQHLKGFSGSTILGDGRPALILEPADLLSHSSRTMPRSELRRSA